MLNQNMFRWLFASITKHADTNKQGVKLWLTGQEIDTQDSTSYFRMKISDFGHIEPSNGTDIYTIRANINVVSSKDESNLHTIYTNIGIANAILGTTIKVYKYGNGVQDDDTLIGCLEIVGTIATNYYGILEPGTGIQQATVEASFKLEI